jgi:glutaredoxin
MRDALLIVSVVLGLNAMASSTPHADQTIEQIAEAPKFVSPEPVAEPVAKKDAYSVAYAEAETTGKLCVYIGATWCKYCPAAKATFEANAPKQGSVCLDFDADSKYVKDIQAATGVTSVPQVVVYTKVSGEWIVSHVVGNKTRDIQIALAGKNPGATGVSILSTVAPGRSSCSCDSCPRDCAANGCDCGKQPSAGSGCASCGVSQGLPRRGFMRGRR